MLQSVSEVQDAPALPVQARFSLLVLRALDAWRSRQPGLPSRAKAISTLVEEALKEDAA